MMVKVAHHFKRKKKKLAFEFLLFSCNKRKTVAYSLRHLLHITPGLREVCVIYAGSIVLLPRATICPYIRCVLQP